MNSSSGNISHVVIAITNSISFLMCLLAVIFVLALKLYKKLVYRLALYQVLASLLMATVQTLQVVFINYNESPSVYRRVCVAIGWFMMYAEWTKLSFAAWVTFHLFCFGVLHKNLKKLEALYVVTSLLVPALIAVVPLITNSYGLSADGTVCYVYANQSTAFVERLAIWDVPAMFILLVASTAMVVMVMKLACRVRWRSKYERIADGDQFEKAIKQLLPLAAFPILFFLFEIPVLIFRIYVAKYKAREALLISTIVFFSLWSFTSGATLLVHISVSQWYGRKRKSKSTKLQRETTSVNTLSATESFVTVNSATNYPLPSTSVV